MCEIVFEKAKGCSRTVKITIDYEKAAVQSGSIKKVL